MKKGNCKYFFPACVIMLKKGRGMIQVRPTQCQQALLNWHPKKRCSTVSSIFVWHSTHLIVISIDTAVLILSIFLVFRHLEEAMRKPRACCCALIAISFWLGQVVGNSGIGSVNFLDEQSYEPHMWCHLSLSSFWILIPWINHCNCWPSWKACLASGVWTALGFHCDNW